MQKRKTDEKGFTLIEVIVTLVLVGITAALAGMWIVSVANGYVFAKMNASTTQKAQLAMTRLVKEFSSINLITSSSGNQIIYTRTDSVLATTSPYTVSQTGSNSLLLNGYILTDSVSVSGFTLRYCSTNDLTCTSDTWIPGVSKIIEIKLTLMGGSNTPVEFVQRVIPRNL